MSLEMATVTVIEQIGTHLLHPHPCNQKIYGSEDVAELAERIKVSGWIKPLVVTQDNRIISGHRRWQTAISLGYNLVPAERRTFASETEELEALLLENQFRDKTPEQKVREAGYWKEIEVEKARQRMSEAVSAKNSGVENFPHLDTGKSRDKVAEHVGFGSGRSLEKAAQVVKTADQLKEQGKEEEGQALLNVLNMKSVDAASKIVKLPEPEQITVLETIASGKTVKEALATVSSSTELEEEEEEPLFPRPVEITRETPLDAKFPGWHMKPDREATSAALAREEALNDALIDAKEKHDAHIMRVMGSSDSPEWYTPRHIVDLVRQMFGTVDTDPCSNSHESPTVPARILYTKEDDGLSYTWTGKTYLNPPYGTEISAWTDKLVDEYKAGNVTEALALLPGRIDTVWFSPLYNYLMCNVRGRLQFANSPYNAPFPCVVVYLGGRRSAFIETFKKLGPIMERVG